MPRIAELKVMDGALWARVGTVGEFVNGIALMTPEEQKARYHDGWVDCIYFQPRIINWMIRKYGKWRPSL